ncbi:MAG: hypothetical protein SOZ34_03860, partial [Clostridia bacterium]|nr:hypothetical protein [Clostridia bacterium]
MKQKLMIIVMVISLAMQCIIALPAYAVQQLTTEYNLILKNRYALKDMNGGAISYGKSLALKEIDGKTLAYVLKEGGTPDNKPGGIYVYDVTNVNAPECIQYVGNIGGVDISSPPQAHNELELMETGSGDYIAFSDQAWNNTKIRAAKILDAGLIDASTIITADGEKTYGFDLQAVGDYLFVSRKNLSGYQYIFDVYKLENDTLSKKGSIATSTGSEGNEEEEVEAYTVERDGNSFVVYAGVKRKDGISSNRHFEVHKGNIGNDGNITFIKQYTSQALENKEIFALSRVGEGVFMLGTGNDNHDKTTYYLDADTYSVIEAPAQYINDICDLEDGYYVSAGRGNLQMYKDKETIQILGGVTNLPEQMIKTDKYIYVLCWDNLEIYSYKTEVDITSNGGNIIEPEYKLEAIVGGITTEDRIVVSFDGSDMDVTSIVANGKLVTSIPVTNGEHVVEVKILRNGEVFLCDSVNINVAIEPQLKISNTQLTDNRLIFDMENLYSDTLSGGTVVAFSYDFVAMTGKGKLNLTTLDDVAYGKEITLDGYSAGNNVIIFAISSLENPKLISNVIRIGDVDFGTVIDKNSITRITDKPNA